MSVSTEQMVADNLMWGTAIINSQMEEERKLSAEEVQVVNITLPLCTLSTSVTLHRGDLFVLQVSQGVKLHKNKQFVEDVLGWEVQEQSFKQCTRHWKKPHHLFKSYSHSR